MLDAVVELILSSHERARRGAALEAPAEGSSCVRHQGGVRHPGIKWTNVGAGCRLQKARIHRSLETCSLHLMFPDQIRNLH